jgi:hypothetical protein
MRNHHHRQVVAHQLVDLDVFDPPMHQPLVSLGEAHRDLGLGLVRSDSRNCGRTHGEYRSSRRFPNTAA